MARGEVPVVQREVGINVPSNVPDYQSAYQKLADSSNILSPIGAYVTQVASNHVATQLGYEAGKNPTGDLALPSLTEFDRNFAESYHQQASATLSTQASKLLDDAHVEMSKAVRITPELIARTNAQLTKGLDQIFASAPTKIRGKLEATYTASLFKQTNDYKEKMFSEQREDQKNNIINAISVNEKSIYEISKSGNIQVADEALKNNISMINNAVANHDYTPEQGAKLIASSRQSYLNGKYGYIYSVSDKTGKSAEFEKAFAENKPAEMTNEEHIATAQSISQQRNFLNTFRAQDQGLKVQNMENQIASNVNAITDSQWQSFANSVSPLRAEETKFKYIQALKSRREQGLSEDTLIQNYSDPRAHANADGKVKDATFNRLVNYQMEQNKNSVTPVSRDMAEVQVAASAGAEVPVFTRSLKNKLRSANPAMIESAAQQVHTLLEQENGNALAGLNEKDHALIGMYDTLKTSMLPSEAAREATNIAYNQDPTTMQANEQKWKSQVYNIVRGGKTPDLWVLPEVGLDPDKFLNPSMAHAYGAVVFKKYESYFKLSNGDADLARKLTTDYVKQVFGTTRVNGDAHTTLHPVEKSLGFKNSDGVPYIQNDFRKQFKERMDILKNNPGKNIPGESWEVIEPAAGPNKISPSHGIFTQNYDPVRLKYTNSVTKKKEIYDVVLNGNAYNGWDISVNANGYIRPLMQIAPYLGIQVYIPDKKAITDKYNSDHNLH